MSVPLGKLAAEYFSMRAVNMGGNALSFAGVTAILALATARAASLYAKRRDRSLLALIWTAWASIVAPLSWILLIKGHSAYHMFIDPIVWHMPFTIFALALCAFAVKGFVERRGSHKTP